MSFVLLVALISFLGGFSVSFYATKKDIKEAKSLEELKIRYSVKENE